MEVIYLISVIIILVSFILVEKTKKPINILGFLGISIVGLFCYNTFVCYILTFFTIPVTLFSLSIINILISLLFIILIIRNKQIQKYIFNKVDLIYISLIAIVILIISYINFGIPFNIKYETSDPSVHYLTSVMFAESDALLAGVEDDAVYGSFNVRKTVSYVNSGLLMKCFCNDLKPMDCYNVFVLFGILTLFLTGVTMYFALINFAKNQEHKLWAFVVSLICVLGYPLNSFLFGFEYLSMGLLIICVIINLIDYYDKEILSLKYFILLMTLLNFGLFASYYMFVPFVYPALWIYFYIKNYQKTKKIITKEVIFLWAVTLLLPFILGYIYHIEPNMYAIFINKSASIENIVEYSSHLINTGLAANGYIYINLYSNMLLLLPLTIYLFIKDAKNNNLKNNYFICILLFFIIAFIEILMIGYKMEKVSIYYLSKNYFALWIILMYCNYKALIQLSENNNYLPRLFIGSYVFLMIICTIFSNVKMIDDALKNKDETLLSVMEIFGSNKTMLIKEKEKLNQNEIDILMYARDNLDYNSEIEVVSEGIQYYWSYALLRYINDEELTEEYYAQPKMNLKSYLLKEKVNNVDYMIYFNRSKRYQQLKDRLFENAEIIYENEAGGILKYNR